ncbi:MAG: hypothetical protein V3T54_04805 [Acidobacteriota bacterium]
MKRFFKKEHSLKFHEQLLQHFDTVLKIPEPKEKHEKKPEPKKDDGKKPEPKKDEAKK